MITYLKDSGETGIYGLAYQFGMIPLVLTTTFENIWIPWFTEKMKKSDKDAINKMVRPYVTSVLLVCSIIMLVTPEVFKLLTTEEYYSGIGMLPPIIMSVFLIFLGSLSLNLEYYLRETKTIAINTLVAASVNILLNFIFIPKCGGIAAAYTTMISYMVSFIMHYVVARRLDKTLFGFQIYIIPLLVSGGVCIMAKILTGYAVIRWGIAVVLGVSLCLILYKLIKEKNKA